METWVPMLESQKSPTQQIQSNLTNIAQAAKLSTATVSPTNSPGTARQR